MEKHNEIIKTKGKYSTHEHRFIEILNGKLPNFFYQYFDILSCKMEKIAKLYEKSADQQYEKQVKMFDLSKAKNMLHIGCGAYPATAIAIAKLSDARIVTLDKNPKAVEYAKNVIRKKNLESRIIPGLGDAVEYPVENFDTILVGGLSYPKQKILMHLFETAKPQTKIIFKISFLYYKLILHHIAIPDNIFIEKKIETTWTLIDVFGRRREPLVKSVSLSFIKK